MLAYTVATYTVQYTCTYRTNIILCHTMKHTQTATDTQFSVCLLEFTWFGRGNHPAVSSTHIHTHTHTHKYTNTHLQNHTETSIGIHTQDTSITHTDTHIYRHTETHGGTLPTTTTTTTTTHTQRIVKIPYLSSLMLSQETSSLSPKSK